MIPVAGLEILPPVFYARDALVVARDLLGKLLVRDDVALRITEVEAYRWPDDTASHARVGQTARNAAMWGPPGHAYVYLCYGVHNLLNLVTNLDGEAAAVLIRACEPVAGLETIRARRGGLSGRALLTGPGKVGAALGIDRSWSGNSLFERDGLHLLDQAPPARVLSGPRVGIDYASAEHRKAPWRLACGDTIWVSKPTRLTDRS
ncbi:MAG: DNA-3-methyladenine glycosylase [bacterium]|nr:DNA-3-methyladenine glycosylase [bacterium]